jgi:uncharacterized protein YggE
MIRPLLLAFFLALPLMAHPVQTRAAEELRTISVQGIGSAAGQPDLASASAGIESRGSTPDDALSANTKAMNTLMAAIKRHGIQDRDIQTNSFNVNPIYAQQPNQRGTMTIEGYLVSNQVNVRVRDLNKLGGLLSSLVEAGANRLHGVSFEIADPASLRDQARKAAIADAKKRADLYAAAAGVSVKRVMSIAEGGGFAPPMPVAMRAMKGGAEDVPVASGEQSINASVNVVYEIE